MWRFRSLACAAFIAAAGFARAADIPSAVRDWRPPAGARPAVPALKWSGWYYGSSIGGAWSAARWNTTCLQPGVAGANCPLGLAGANRFTTQNPADFNTLALRGGIFGGINVQLSRDWVGSLEADFAVNAKSGSRPGIPGAEDPAAAGSPGGDAASVRHVWETGFRARAGYLVAPSLMAFATAGVAMSHVEIAATCGGGAFPAGWCANPANTGRTDAASTNRTGWTLGGGLEWMTSGGWMLRAEYRYSDFGTWDTALLSLPTSNIDAILTRLRLRRSTVLFGLAYKF